MQKKDKQVLNSVSMKFEEKRRKNKNSKISRIVRIVVTPEVYNQRQNSLSLFECVEHRMFKVTWEKLCGDSDVCTVECTFWCTCGSAVRDARMAEAPTVRSRRTDWLCTC